MSNRFVKISFIILCFNEENNIQNTVKEILDLSRKCSLKNIELIIIDDGSNDKTYEKIKTEKKLENSNTKKT